MVTHAVVTTGLSLSEVQYRVKIEGDRRCKDYETIVSSVCKHATWLRCDARDYFQNTTSISDSGYDPRCSLAVMVR